MPDATPSLCNSATALARAEQPAPLLTTEDVAVILGVSPKSLNNMRSKGYGPPYIKLGGAVRYRRADLDAYLDARTRRPSEVGRRARGTQAEAA